jgi:hypothetical protein
MPAGAREDCRRLHGTAGLAATCAIRHTPRRHERPFAAEDPIAAGRPAPKFQFTVASAWTRCRPAHSRAGVNRFTDQPACAGAERRIPRPHNSAGHQDACDHSRTWNITTARVFHNRNIAGRPKPRARAGFPAKTGPYGLTPQAAAAGREAAKGKFTAETQRQREASKREKFLLLLILCVSLPLRLFVLLHKAGSACAGTT